MPLDLQIFCVTPVPSLTGALCLFVLRTAVKGWRTADGFLDSLVLFHILTSMQFILFLSFFVLFSFKLIDELTIYHLNFIWIAPFFTAILFPNALFAVIQFISLVKDVGIAPSFGVLPLSQVDGSGRRQILTLKEHNCRAIALNFMTLMWQGLLICGTSIDS